jgi:hypothetical protein
LRAMAREHRRQSGSSAAHGSRQMPQSGGASSESA